MNVEITNIPPEFDRYNTTAELLEACQASPMSEYPLPGDRWHISSDAWDEWLRQELSQCRTVPGTSGNILIGRRIQQKV